jgi:glutaredoxin
LSLKKRSFCPYSKNTKEKKEKFSIEIKKEIIVANSTFNNPNPWED